MVEARSGNISVGTSVAGIVKELYVKVGDTVEKGQPLFKIDDARLQAQRLATAAKVKEAEANLRKPRDKLRTAERLKRLDENAISPQELIELRDDVAVASSALASEQAQLESLERQIELCTVRAPISGRILQARLRVGEYAQDGGNGAPLMVVGDVSQLHVRVDINEDDAWRIREDARAMAYLRGNHEIAIPLDFVRVEPYVVPKQDLTGQSAERTDVRVMQVIYGFEKQDLPVYIGQQLDVYIEAPAAKGQ
jgi:RND family efflux transporter MFP subunit